MKSQYTASHARYVLKRRSIKRLKIPFFGFCFIATSQRYIGGMPIHKLTGEVFRRHLDFGFSFTVVIKS